MQVGLTVNYQASKVQPLRVTKTATPALVVASIDNEDILPLMSMAIPAEWQTAISDIYQEERKLIEKRRALLVQYRQEFKEILKNRPELLI